MMNTLNGLFVTLVLYFPLQNFPLVGPLIAGLIGGVFARTSAGGFVAGLLGPIFALVIGSFVLVFAGELSTIVPNFVITYLLGSFSSLSLIHLMGIVFSGIGGTLGGWLGSPKRVATIR